MIEGQKGKEAAGGRRETSEIGPVNPKRELQRKDEKKTRKARIGNE